MSVPPAPVRTSAVSTAKVPTMWPLSYHKQGSNLLKGHILHLGPLRRKSRQVHKVSPLERSASSSLVATLYLCISVSFAPTASRKCLFPAEACRRCFFCKSVCFCDQCKRCSGCCNLSSCRGQAAGVLADLGFYGSQSTGGVHFKERLHPPFSDKASACSGTFDSERLCDFRKAEPFAGVGLITPTKTSCQTSTQPVLPRVLQLPLFSSKIKQQIAAHFGSQCSEPVSACKIFQELQSP